MKTIRIYQEEIQRNVNKTLVELLILEYRVARDVNNLRKRIQNGYNVHPCYIKLYLMLQEVWPLCQKVDNKEMDTQVKGNIRYSSQEDLNVDIFKDFRMQHKHNKRLPYVLE